MNLSKRQKFGLLGEEWVKSELHQRGFSARSMSSWNACFDLVVDGCLPVEVKISQQIQQQVRPGYYRPYYRFDVSRLPRDEDFIVFLVCQDKDRLMWPYIVPSWLFLHRFAVNITSHPTQYEGMYSAYLNGWSKIADVIETRKRLGQGVNFSYTVQR